MYGNAVPAGEPRGDIALVAIDHFWTTAVRPWADVLAVVRAGPSGDCRLLWDDRDCSDRRSTGFTEAVDQSKEDVSLGGSLRGNVP
jgi:hypothetical protein